MLLNTAPVNEAVLSNVGEIGEFRIRNSAKAFNILSSGLYANKIKAIIRELSCNAVDSHVAAGKPDVPFDVHLPTQLEPWFAIRDYGTGLDHHQVTNIYTTYFESTKTTSNEFIGALGLGSKSPFSYTDNFTVTAIKDGRKGIYTAFINDMGVPSIALMTEEQTDEPAGVEVRFAVEDYYDCRKFEQEADNVYRYFKLRPVITGAQPHIRNVEFSDENIVPGVHAMRDSRRSIAIMGNIAYTIEVPNASTNLGNLEHLLNCGLMIEFNIGDVDFQASREGLSYIPQTINAIKAKLELVRDALTDRLAADANQITCLWERSAWLWSKREHALWSSSVEKYVADTNFPLLNNKPGTWEHMRPVKMTHYETELASKYNIVIRGFTKARNAMGVNNMTAEQERIKTADGSLEYKTKWEISPNMHTVFVKNNTKVGATERARYHWRHTRFPDPVPYQTTVYVLDVADKEKPALFDAFLAALHNPPVHMFADTLLQKEREKTSAAKGETVSILKLCEDDRSWRTNYVWRDAGKASTFDAKTKFYYLPLSGYAVESKYGIVDAKDLKSTLSDCGIAHLASLTVYGVRKSDIEFIKTQKNWINLEDEIHNTLVNLTTAQKAALASNRIDWPKFMQYNSDIVKHVTKKDNLFIKVVGDFKSINRNSFDERSLKSLFNRFAKDTAFDIELISAEFSKRFDEVNQRYPLLANIDYYRCDMKQVAHYIDLIDNATKE